MVQNSVCVCVGGGGRDWPGGSCSTTMQDMLGNSLGLGFGKKSSELNL